MRLGVLPSCQKSLSVASAARSLRPVMLQDGKSGAVCRNLYKNDGPFYVRLITFRRLYEARFSQVLLLKGLSWLVTFWPLRNESHNGDLTHRFAEAWQSAVANDVVHISGSVVAISLRSQE